MLCYIVAFIRWKMRMTDDDWAGIGILFSVQTYPLCLYSYYQSRLAFWAMTFLKKITLKRSSMWVANEFYTWERDGCIFQLCMLMHMHNNRKEIDRLVLVKYFWVVQFLHFVSINKWLRLFDRSSFTGVEINQFLIHFWIKHTRH